MATERPWANQRRASVSTWTLKTLFDSSVLIDHLRGESKATEMLLSTGRQDRFASVLSRIELEGGMRSGERSAVAALFATMTLLPVTDGIARRAGEFLRTHRRTHPGIDIIDYAIAATAEIHGAQLVTLNVKHFPMSPGLKRPW